MTNDLTTTEERTEIAAASSNDMLFNRQAFEQAQRVANLFAHSQLVPQHLRGKPADCFIALHMAHRLREDPLMIAQNMLVIHGQPGWKAQYMIARANRSGIFKGRIRFRTEGEGPSLKVTAYAELADTGDTVEASASMKMATAEGWTKNPKYQSLPEQMLSYRAAAFLVRLYCPEVMMGYQTAEEVEDMAKAGTLPAPENEGAAAVQRLIDSEDTPGEPEPPEPGDTDEGEVQEAQTQPAEPDPEPPANTVELYNEAGESQGEYAKVGSYLNAFEKLLEAQPDREAAQSLWQMNGEALTRLGDMDRYGKRVAGLAERVSQMPAAEAEAPPEDQDTTQSDDAGGDNGSDLF